MRGRRAWFIGHLCNHSLFTLFLAFLKAFRFCFSFYFHTVHFAYALNAHAQALGKASTLQRTRNCTSRDSLTVFQARTPKRSAAQRAGSQTERILKSEKALQLQPIAA